MTDTNAADPFDAIIASVAPAGGNPGGNQSGDEFDQLLVGLPKRKIVPTARDVAPAIPTSKDANDQRPSSRDASSKWQPNSAGEYAAQRGRQLASGATEAVASLPEALEIADRGRQMTVKKSSEEVLPQLAKERDELNAIVSQNQAKANAGDWEAKARIKAAENRLYQVNGQMQMAGRMKEDTGTALALPIEDSLGFKAGKGIRNGVSATIGQADPRDDTFGGKVAYGFGNMIGMLATTTAAGIATGGTGAMIVGAGQGAAMNSSQIYKEAIAAGASEEAAVAASQWAGVAGMSEILPIMSALKFVPASIRGKVTNKLLEKVGEIAVDATGEGLQEYGQQVVNNLIASGMVPGTEAYDPKRKWDEGALEAAIIGSIIGGSMGTAGVAIHRGEVSPDQAEALKTKTEAPAPDATAAAQPAAGASANATAQASVPAPGVAPDQAAALGASKPKAPTTKKDILTDILGAPSVQAPAQEAPAQVSAEAPAQAAPAPVTPEGNAAPAKTPGPDAAGDTLPTVPESADTIAAQNKALLDPKNPRKAVFIPYDNTAAEAPHGAGIKMLPLDEGMIYYDSKAIGEKSIKLLYKNGQLGKVLGLGNFNKADVAKSVAQGNPEVAVTERTPDGTEVKAAAGTTATASDQVATLEADKTPGNTVQVETPEQVLNDRKSAAAGALDELNAVQPATEQVEKPTEQVASPSAAAGALAELSAAEKAAKVREQAIRALEPQLTEMGLSVEQVLAMPQAKQRTAIDKAKAMKAKPEAKAETKAETKSVAPKAQKAKETAKAREETPKAEPKAEPKVTTEGNVTVGEDGSETRIEVDPKTGKRQIIRTTADVKAKAEEAEAARQASIAALAAREAKLEAEQQKAEKDAAEQDEKDTKDTELAFRRQRANSGGFASAAEEARSRIPKDSHKGKAVNDAFVQRAVKADTLAKSLVPQDQDTVENLPALEARLGKTLEIIRKAKITLGTEVSDTIPNALTWMMQVKTTFDKLERLKNVDTASTASKIKAEIAAFLDAEQEYFESGDTTQLRELRKIEGEEGARSGGSSSDVGESPESQVVDENSMTPEEALIAKQEAQGKEADLPPPNAAREPVAEKDDSPKTYSFDEKGNAKFETKAAPKVETVKKRTFTKPGAPKAEKAKEVAKARTEAKPEVKPARKYGEMLKDGSDVGADGRIGPFAFSFEETGEGARYLRVRTTDGSKLFQSAPGSERDANVTDIWSSVDPNQHEKRRGNKVGLNSVEENTPPDLAPVFRDWLEGKIDNEAALSRIKDTEVTSEVTGKAETKAERPSIVRMARKTLTPAFKKWFGNSKVVTPEGKPQVVYHGTAAAIEAFDPSKLGDATGAPSASMGYFFAASPKVASSYAYAFNWYKDTKLGNLLSKLSGGRYEVINEALLKALKRPSAIESGENVIPVYLSIENPLVVDFKGSKYREKTYADIITEAKAAGHDGVILRNTVDEGFIEGEDGDQVTDIFVAFEPTQIKSTMNEGTFNPDDARISKMGREPAPAGYTQEEWDHVTGYGKPDPLTDARALLDTMGTYYYDDDVVTDDIKDAIMGELGTKVPEAKFANDTSSVRGELDRMDNEEIREYASLVGPFTPAQRTAQFEATSRVYRMLAKLAGSVKVHYLEDTDVNRFDPHALAYYNPDGDYIVMRESLLSDPGRFFHVLTHEVAHAAFWHALRADPIVGTQVEALRKIALKWAAKNGLDTDMNGLKNLDEFVSDAFADPKFQEFLSGIKLGLGDLMRLGTTVTRRGKIETALDWMKTKVAEVFGFSTSGPTAFDAAMQFGEKLMDASVSARKAYYKRNPTLAAPRSKMEAPKPASVETKLKKLGLNERQAKSYAKTIKDFYNNQVTDEQLSEIAKRVKEATKAAKEAVKEAKAAAETVEPALRKKADDFYEEMEKTIESSATPGAVSETALKLMKGSQIARMADRWFGSEINPVRKIVDLLNHGRVLKRRYVKELGDRVAGFEEALANHTPEQIKEFFSLAHDSTLANVHPDRPLDQQTHLGKDALKGMWSKAQHERLAKRYEALPQDLKDLYHRVGSTLAEAQNKMAHGVMRNILNAAGFTDEAMIKRFFENEATEADYVAVGENLAEHLKKATELKKIQGPYFNLVRRGNTVVRGSYMITPPGNAKVIAPAEKGDVPNTFEFKTRKEAIAFAQSKDLKEFKTDIKSTWIDEKTGKTYYEDEKGQVKVSPQDGTNVFRVIVQNEHVEFVDGKRAAKKLHRELSAQGLKMKDVEAKRYQRNAANADMLSDQYRSLMETAKERNLTSKLTPVQKAELIGVLNEFSLRQLGATRIQSSKLPRRHVLGASQDLVRNTYDYINEVSGYLAKLDTQPGIDEAMHKMEAGVQVLSAKNKGFATGARNIANEISKRVLDVDYSDRDGALNSAIQRLTTVTYLMRLGSAGFSIINSTQPLALTLPHLAGDFNPGSASYHLIKAYHDISAVKVVGNGLVDSAKGLANIRSDGDTHLKDVLKRITNPREREMLQRMVDLNLMGEDSDIEVKRLADQSEGAIRLFDVPIGYLENIMRALPQAVEINNRSVTALAAYRLMYSKTKNHEKSMQYAADAVDETQGNNSAINSPPVFNSHIGRLMLQFKKYPQNIIVLLAKNIRRSVMGGKPGERRKGMLTMAYLMGATQVAAGTMGLPWEPAKLILMAARGLGLADDEWEDFQQKVRDFYAWLTGSDKAAEMLTRGVTRGLPYGLDFDTSSRMGWDTLLTFGEPRSGKEADVKSWLFDTGLGANAGTIYDIGSGIVDMAHGDIAKGAAEAFPLKVGADTIKAFDGKAGHKTIQQKALTILGLRPGEAAREQEKPKHDALQRRYLSATSAAEVAKLTSQIRAYNATLPKGSSAHLSLPSLEKKRQEEYAKNH